MVAHHDPQRLDATPAQDRTMKADPNSINIRVDEHTEARELSMAAKVSHLFAIVVSGVIALCVAAVLADGSSVVKLKDPSQLPRLTEPDLIQYGLDYRADELLGPSYGVGLHHDSSGYTWTQAGAGDTLQKYVDELGLHQVIAAVPSVIATDGLKHPAHFLSCHELKATGQTAMAFGFIAEIVAAIMIIFHSLALLGVVQTIFGGRVSKRFASLVWFVIVVGFLIVCCLAIGAIQTTWTCHNPFIKSIKLAEHFYYNRAFPIAYVGYTFALLIFVVQLNFTSTEDGKKVSPESHKNGIAKTVGGVLAGIVFAIIASLIVAAANNSFVEASDPDPTVNPCEGQKPIHAGPGDTYFVNVPCMKDGIVAVLEQAGANVTRGYVGGLDAGEWRVPITEPFNETDLCPVNVHWHVGAEHLSVGEFDEHGTGPMAEDGVHLPDGYCHEEDGRRQLAGECTRMGFRCHHYDVADPKFTKPYEWQHCTDMKVGETYEVHWPHSAAGACGTQWQYQTPFYDGVFCRDGIVNILTPLNTYKKIGVQSQIFTVVNDEAYFHNLFGGMIVEGDYGADIAMYTGSTTGTSRDNDLCSRYAPITWQVDRKCHLISASSFDKMCERMKAQSDDMTGDIVPHGSRELVADNLVANNQQNRA